MAKMGRMKIAQEMVSFQNDNLKRVLSFQFEELRKQSEEELKDLGIANLLSKEIESSTNIKTTIVLGNEGPHVHMPDVNKNNPMINQAYRKYLPNATGLKLAESAGGLISGTVDLNKAKVGGVFAEIEHQIHFPIKMIKDTKYTTDELAAILLHEVGHIFVYYEFIIRSVTTNVVLEGVSRTLSSTNDPKEIEAVLVTAKKALRLDGLDVKQLTKSNNKKVTEMVILFNAVEQSRSELGSDIYDMNSFEALADNFATRLGAGRDLVTALDKVHRSHFNISTRSTGMFIFMEALKIFTFIGSIILSFGTAFTLLSFLGRMSINAAMTLFILDLNSPEYDRPGFRIKRIRDQLVQRSKEKDISKAERKSIIDSLEVIDKVTADMNNNRQLITVIGSMFSSSIRNRYKQEEIQSELESLISNDLYEFYNQVKSGA